MKQSQYRRIWFTILKLSIVVGAGYYLYIRVFLDAKIENREFLFQLDTYIFQNVTLLIILISLSVLNWLFEIWKWQTLVSHIVPISFYEAAKQSLSSHTVSIVTPFKMGEYGGKALYFHKQLRKRILLLNFIGNAAQLLATIAFGIAGILYFMTNFEISFNVYKLRRLGYLIAFLIVTIFTGTRLGQRNRTGYYQKAIEFLKSMSWRIKGKTLGIALFRYILFSHQFYFLLVIFGVDVSYEVAMLLIFSMYFLATLLPVFSLFDFVIKGSVAVYLFSFIGVNELKILSVSLLMWLLNFVIPAIFGSFFVFSYNSNSKIKFA